jgi:adenylate cyclase
MSSEAFVFQAPTKLNFSKGRSRKHATVLFSDLSGHTAMSEKLDPEEVKEIMSRIFGEIAQVVTKYEGFVEKFVGNAVNGSFRCSEGSRR